MHAFTHSKPRPFASPCFSLRKPQGHKRNRLIIPPPLFWKSQAVTIFLFCYLIIWFLSIEELTPGATSSLFMFVDKKLIIFVDFMVPSTAISFCVVTFSRRRLSTLHDKRHESRKIKICWFKQAGQTSLYGKCINHMSKLSYDSFLSLILPKLVLKKYTWQSFLLWLRWIFVYKKSAKGKIAIS